MSSRHIPTKRSTRVVVPYNPETSVGLQAALVAPASAHLHVAEPVRRSARIITLQAVTTTDRRRNTPYCMMTSSRFCVDDGSLFCKLCDRRMHDRIIYMYMSMGFCTEECRNEYFLDYRCRLTMATVEAEGRSEARKPVEAAAATTTEGQGVGYRRIFFTCAEVESFP